MMNGARGGDIRSMMEQLARQNAERIKFFLLRFGMPGLSFDALGGNLVKCVCGSRDCSGHAVQFEGRAHFTRRGLEVIPRTDAQPMAQPIEPPEAVQESAAGQEPRDEEADPLIVLAK